jgi:putative hydrolase of the HAD superfamily
MTRPPAALAVVFDLDDTLFAERSFVLSGFAAAGVLAEQAWGLRGFAQTCIDLHDAGFRGDVFDRALALRAMEAAPDAVAQLVATYREHEPQLSLLPDALAAIVSLADANVTMGLITDGPEAVQQRKIEALGLPLLLDVLITTDTLGGRTAWKPAADGFHALMRRVPAARYVYVGDNLTKDFVAPNALGWTTIHVRRPEGLYTAAEAPAGGAPQIRINSLVELAELCLPLLRTEGSGQALRQQRSI